jgi:hypothetical protein
MSTADQIEKIVLNIEEQGAGKAYIGVTRLDGAVTSLEAHKGPTSFADTLEAVSASSTKLKMGLGEIGMSFAELGVDGARSGREIQRLWETLDRKHARNSALEGARQDAQQLAAAQRAANRVPTELQQAPPSIDWAGALASQSQKAGSAIEAAAHSALDEATALGEAAKNAQKLASVYDVIENRAKAAARADQRWLDQKMRAANRVPTELQAASAPKGLSAGQKFMQGIGRTFGPKATQGITSVVEGLEKIGPVVSKIGPPLGMAAGAVLALGVAAAGGAAVASKEFAFSVIEAQAYREDVLGAFKIVRRTQGDAEAVMRLANTTSDRLGVGRAEGAGQFLELLSKGFDPKQTQRIIASLADLSVVDPNASIEGLTRVIGKIKAMNKLSQDSITELSTAGLEAGDLYAALGKQFDKSIPDIQKMLSTGKIDASGLESVLAAIGSQVGGGKAGDAAAKKANENISSLIKRAKDIPQNILFDLEVGPGMANVKTTIRSVLSFFDSGSRWGQMFRENAGAAFNALIEGLTGVKAGDAKGLQFTLAMITTSLKDAAPAMRMIGKGINLAGTAIFTTLGAIGGMISAWDDFTSGVSDTGSSISSFFDNLGTSASSGIDSLIESVKSGGMSIFNDALNIGMNMWQGLVQGIQGGIGAVTGAATSLANSALGAVGLTWKVGSPARAFEDQSLWAAAGAERGFYKGTGSVVDAAGYMAGAALGAASMTPANGNAGPSLVAAGGGAAGGAVVINFSPTIIVPGASSPAQAQAIGAAAAAGARPEFEAMLGATARRLRYG